MLLLLCFVIINFFIRIILFLIALHTFIISPCILEIIYLHTPPHAHGHTHVYIHIYILFKKSKIYIKTFKTLLHVSITRSSSESIYCSLLSLWFKTFSELRPYVNFGVVAACCGFMWVVRYLEWAWLRFTSYAVQRESLTVRRVECESHSTQRTVHTPFLWHAATYRITYNDVVITES